MVRLRHRPNKQDAQLSIQHHHEPNALQTCLRCICSHTLRFRRRHHHHRRRRRRLRHHRLHHHQCHWWSKTQFEPTVYLESYQIRCRLSSIDRIRWYVHEHELRASKSTQQIARFLMVDMVLAVDTRRIF
jgi:hypothetical protein